MTAPRDSGGEGGVMDISTDVRFQQRPPAINSDGSGGWFCARANGWTPCVDHTHGSPEGASACFRRAINQETTHA